MREDEPTEKKARVTLWLPECLVEQAKIRAIRKRSSLSRMVTELLRQALEQQDHQS
jgi:Family of unknown function (DUF6364)